MNPHAPDHALIPAAVDVLAATPAVMRELLAPLPDALVAAPGEGGWSARDVVAHLAARQQAAIVGRVSAVLERPGAPFPPVPESLMDVAPYRSRPLGELLAQFEEGRADAVALLRRLTPQQLEHGGIHAGVGEVTLAELIHHLAFHDLVHIAQAAQLALAPLDARRGAMRAFR
jgi:hypothetical protein